MSFIAEDRFVASEKFIQLAREIDKYAIANQLTPSNIYFAPKVIPKYDVEKAKKGGEAFTKKRAVLIKMRSRMPPAGSRMKMVIALRLYKDLDDTEFAPDIKAALKAIEKHNLRAEKLITSGKESAKKKRDTLAKAFDKNLDAVEKVLLDAGLKTKDLAIGQSMMGKTMIVKLPNGGYISIGKADEEKFLKAKEPIVAGAGAFGRKPAEAVVPARKSRREKVEEVPARKSRREKVEEVPARKSRREKVEEPIVSTKRKSRTTVVEEAPVRKKRTR